MHAKSKRTQTKTRTRRRRRTCKRAGMFRAARSATSRVVSQVMGKGFERADKVMQIGKAVLNGATQSKPTETFTPTKSSLQTFSPPTSIQSPPIIAVSTHRTSRVSDYYKTPKKNLKSNSANTDTPPKLGTRARRRETPEERRMRLGIMAAPTINDTVSVVGELFPLL